ncbi:HNH endonuclease signature motif containing protein [Acidisoma sp. S159]|uniref:HNH endonuclease n=1 Tax=Acidisoma sp. S159 TaxID=1747225 RepID=UPI00131E86F6|nr:HNH endonuclease signature motif containing protein [Acidisoma sp. S159]
MHWPFVIHQSYVRRLDIHQPFGGQQQGGISTPAKLPGIFLFTGHGAGIVGYRDEFQADGSLRYTGQGRVGDMRMVAGNAAILDHSARGRDLLVLSQTKKGSRVRFEGLFVCAGWEIERQPDINGQERDAIVFNLAPLRETELEADDMVAEPAPISTLAELRTKAMAAAAPAQGIQANSAATLFRRSRDVRDYVLARAGGICESCKLPAPFTTASGRPFLEAHHIRRLSDGGPDDPRYVAGICPNCHRQAHYGSDHKKLNAALLSAVHLFEAVAQES